MHNVIERERERERERAREKERERETLRYKAGHLEEREKYKNK